MIIYILISVFSVLATLLVLGVIRVVRGLREAKRTIKRLDSNFEIHSKNNESSINYIHQRIDEESHRLDERCNNIDQYNLEEHNKINDERCEDDRIHTETIMKEMDRRFDKLYQRIYDKFPELRKEWAIHGKERGFDNNGNQ